MTETKKILLIGRTGRGKSTLANVLSGTNKFKESGGSVSETKEIQAEHFEDKDNIKYRIIDTVGIGDTKMSDNEILDKIAEAVYLVKDGLNHVFFVIDGRFDQNEMITYNLLRETIFDKDITSYTTIIRTCFENFKSKKKCENDIGLMIKEAEEKKAELENDVSTKEKELESLSSDDVKHKKLLEEIEKLKNELATTNLAEIIKSCQNKFVHIDNPPIEIMGADNEDEEKKKDREEKIKSNQKKREKSREKILVHLKEVCQKEIYNPLNLKELSKKIDDDMNEKKRIKERLKKLKEDLKDKLSYSKGSTKDLRKEVEKLKEEEEELKEKLGGKIKLIRSKIRKHIHSKLSNTELMNYFGEPAQDWLNKRYNNKERVNEIILYQDEWIKGKIVIEDFPKLEKIRIQGESDFKGGLSELTVKKCKQLTYLNCSNNDINELTIIECPNLEEIVCFNSPIVVLNIQDSPNLKSLICFDNLVANLDLSNCPKLKKLECKNNFLTNLDLSQNKELEELNISNNDFSKQDLSFLSHLVNLEKLYLVSNHFCGSLEPLKNLRKLKELDINGSNIDADILKHLDYFPNLKNFIAESGEYFYVPVLRLQIEIDKLNDKLLEKKNNIEWCKNELQKVEGDLEKTSPLKGSLKIDHSGIDEIQQEILRHKQNIDKLQREKEDNINRETKEKLSAQIQVDPWEK